MAGGTTSRSAAILLSIAGTILASEAGAKVGGAEKDLAFDQGVISATAEVCGLDWQALSFRPMMSYWRRIGKSEDDVGFLAVMHGAGQGWSRDSLAKQGCTAAMRRKLRSQLPFKR